MKGLQVSLQNISLSEKCSTCALERKSHNIKADLYRKYFKNIVGNTKSFFVELVFFITLSLHNKTIVTACSLSSCKYGRRCISIRFVEFKLLFKLFLQPSSNLKHYISLESICRKRLNFCLMRYRA